MLRMWNYDKPHRCPECHRIWSWRVSEIPRWWKINTCEFCGARFTGLLAWIPLTRIRVRSLLRRLTR